MQRELETALEHHRAGRLSDAESMYRQILKEEPNNADALHFLGLVAHQLGDYKNAVELIEKAHRYGRPHAVSLNNLGRAYLGLDRFREAKKCFGKALTLKPDFAEAHNNLGAALRGLGQLQEAERSVRRALALKPEYADTHYNLGNLLKDLRRLEDAERSYRQALVLRPGYAEAHNNLGVVLQDLGRKQEVEQCYREALTIRPRYAEAHHNLGNVLRDLGRLEEAERSYREALVLKADVVETQINLGNVLNNLGRFDEAEQYYRQAAMLRPDLAEVHYGLGNILFRVDRQEEAAQTYSRALALKPDFAAARWAFTMSKLPAVYDAEGAPRACRAAFSRELDKLVDWFDSHRSEGPDALVQQPFYLAYQEENNCELLAKYGGLCTGLMQRWLDTQKLRLRQSVAHQVIKVGIVSAHVRDHSVWNALSKSWLRHLDRNRFDVRVFHLGWKQDPETVAAKSMVSHFEQGMRNIREWVNAILDQQLDVLMYPEIGMDTMTAKLAGLRLAPVQLASWGHPETTGLPTIDYYLSAEDFEPDNAARNYTEQLVTLPHLGCFFQSNPTTFVDPDFSRLGIGAESPLLLCCGAPFKYAPQHDWVLTEIAKRLDRCRFIFFTYRIRALSDKLRLRLKRVFERARLDFERQVVFIPWLPQPEFYGLMKRADLFLDTIGFSGFNTAMQAVECGLPIVTKEGRFMRGRFASGILKRMGMTELAAGSDEEYVALAVRLAQDAGYRQQVRARMEAAREVLYGDITPIRFLEDFLVKVTGCREPALR